jgi:hypothetical protein
MDNCVEKIEYKDYTIKLFYDEHCESPREYDGKIGKIVAFHNRYELGDSEKDLGDFLGSINPSDFTGWDEMEEYIRKHVQGTVFPLYLYEHSGITISMSPFSCSWDSGQIGFVVMEDSVIRENWNWKRLSKKRREQAIESLKSEFDEYRRYLEGQCYGYKIFDSEDIEEDDSSCWGMIGSEWAIESAKDGIDAIIRHKEKELISPC